MLKKSLIYIFLAAVLFSTMEIALKWVSKEIHPVQLTFLRFLIGGIVLLPLAFKSLRKRSVYLNLRDFAFFSLTGFICVVVSMMLYQASLLYSQASTVAILFSCNPIFFMIFAFMLLREKIHLNTVVSMIISIVGIMVIINPFQLNRVAAGVILVLLAALTFALYNVVGRTRSARYGGIVQTCMSFLLGSAQMLILMLLTRIPEVSAALTGSGLTDFANIPILGGVRMDLLPALAYIGIGVTGLGYTFFFLAMEETSAATASIVFFIKPALAPVLAFIILQESINIRVVIGIILILSGSLIGIVKSQRIKSEDNTNQEGVRKFD